MRAFDPDPSIRWLFAMTHPDDELSVAAWIHRLTTAGSEVFMSWMHSTPEREEEARHAADLVGVKQDRLSFFASPDGRVLEDIPGLLPLFIAQVKEVRPGRVVCGAFEQGHLDHDATNFLVNRTFSGPVFEAPWYHTYAQRIQTVNRFADPAGEEAMELTREEREFKSRLSRCYPSQRIRDLLVWYRIYGVLSGRSVDLLSTERLRLQTHKDFLTPNLPERIARKVKRTSKWKRWEAFIRELDG